jgi:hypothetical protein
VKKKRLLRPETLRWRVGRHLGRTVYAMHGDQPSDHDVFIGIFDTRALAETAVNDHNGQAEWPTGPWFDRTPS